METFEIVFRSSRRDSPEETEDALSSYLTALWRNGQVLGDTLIAKVGGGYRVFVTVPRADALDRRSSNKLVRQAVKRLRGADVQSPQPRKLGPEPNTETPCGCRRRPYLVLFATFLDNESPVRCGRCFGPVPLYVLPAQGEQGDFSEVLSWQTTYQAIDELFIASGVGEHYSHRQMSDSRSALSKQGRELAANLEAKTRKPVYYYLMKHFGSSDARERRRKCPSCRRPWALSAPLHRIFDFRCDRCRLLSNVAFEVRM